MFQRCTGTALACMCGCFSARCTGNPCGAPTPAVGCNHRSRCDLHRFKPESPHRGIIITNSDAARTVLPRSASHIGAAILTIYYRRRKLAEAQGSLVQNSLQLYLFSYCPNLCRSCSQIEQYAKLIACCYGVYSPSGRRLSWFGLANEAWETK